MSLSLRPDRKNAGKSTIVGKKKAGVEIFQNPFFNLPYLFYFMINRDKLISTIKKLRKQVVTHLVGYYKFGKFT